MSGEPGIRLTAHDDPPPEDRAIVDAGLDAHNRAFAPLADVRALAVFARDERGRSVGGAIGRTWGACVELQQLWVEPSRRRQGLGARLVRAFEEAAAGRGCRTAYLETWSFQAEPLYRALGYRTALAIDGYADDVVKFTMMRDLVPPDAIDIRPADPADIPAIATCVADAYLRWIARIGRQPGPMLDDFAEVVASADVRVAVRDREVVGVLVMRATGDGWQVENVAVRPSVAGRGIGRRLLDLAEAQARARGYSSICLETHQKMTENRAMYARKGYVEVEARVVRGFPRVLMRKVLA